MKQSKSILVKYIYGDSEAYCASVENKSIKMKTRIYFTFHTGDSAVRKFDHIIKIFGVQMFGIRDRLVRECFRFYLNGKRSTYHKIAEDLKVQIDKINKDHHKKGVMG